jgi:hypothetical protein
MAPVRNFYEVDSSKVMSHSVAMDVAKNSREFANKQYALVKYFSDVIHRTFTTACFFVGALSLVGIVGAIFIPGALEIATSAIAGIIIAAGGLVFYYQYERGSHNDQARYFDNQTIVFSTRAAQLSPLLDVGKGFFPFMLGLLFGRSN